ncbi:SAM-binding motif-containing protein [Pseudomonas oryzihabitans]|uniref:class I SAM-dependent methyltransferase n=1 Tax=Pseudomonas rhizoryzae TaxID=2571129 RepID=UPI0007367FFE|nr:class I SAM-dependent methyltransferase [Pseudomonas rhizoryzae]APQ10092.1 SAM-dependent methyltransferase [Pseudomonas psychrotolerans]KTS71339.1 SAM-binding motif-containing protein [Pseudomonas psychrotolerans]KTS95470.1 SAM-binding motif-containing protein [Pseudomonas psychrotolerans]KTT11175.1 SAM-binding motif-containing protein [Pseudomonas psychrotolerans]KTT22793.1 SAM-binding motif-containing protein [Pseudomonas psychrotolerans]
MNKTSYNAIADLFRQARVSLGDNERRYLDVLLENVEPGATLLDLGCGTGTPVAAAILAQGYRVLGVDQAAAMLAHARREFPKQRWIEARLESYACAEPYQGALLWDSLFHLERRWHEVILARVIAGLPRGGRLMLTSGGSANEAFVDRMFDQPFFYDSHPPEVLRALLREQGVRILVDDVLDLPDGSGNRGRCAFVVEKV